MDKPRPYRRLALAAVFIAAIVAFFALGGQRYLTLDADQVESGRAAVFRRRALLRQRWRSLS
jgi:hypothetical protein